MFVNKNKAIVFTVTQSVIMPYMGMSTNVKAFRDLDGRFKDMMEAKLLCEKLKISYPQEVMDYFNGCAGESAAYLTELKAEVKIKTRKHSSEMQDGVEVDVKDIPPEVKTIRFYNSY